MADGIRDAELVVISEAGHFPWVERPAEFRAAVDGFLTGE
jgi:pimeloyl-ACP methyl ester carboxylesterase